MTPNNHSLERTRYTYKKIASSHFEIFFDGEFIGDVERLVGINNRPTRIWAYHYKGKMIQNNSWNTAQKATNALINKHHKDKS